jgi:succinoglycan biosynthesis protein ExoM
MLATSKHHISVCVCTYKRPELLRRLLLKLEKLETDDLFDYSIVIADNDNTESAREIVGSFVSRSKITVEYHVEPEQNIALARNLAVHHAIGDFVAFIDDDEIPIDEWLSRMYTALLIYDADGVLGPVKPLFEAEPPMWSVKAGFFERPNSECRETGFRLHWMQTGTGNVLFRRSILDKMKGPFNSEFGSGGEDLDFFRRLMDSGKVFIWCEEATVYEFVPIERTRLSFQLRRALSRGRGSLKSPAGTPYGIVKSFIACTLYTAMLPVVLLMGRHVFARYLISDFDHIGKLLAVCGINPVGDKYIRE